MTDRASDPDFYVRKGYEVVRLLRDRTTFPRVLPRTHAKDSGYVFTTPSQSKQVKSTVLLCLDPQTPCALVVASDHEDAFVENDVELMAFVKYIGSLVREDLFRGGFAQAIRTLRRDLFPQ